jgi:hypothetical protein
VFKNSGVENRYKSMSPAKNNLPRRRLFLVTSAQKQQKYNPGKWQDDNEQ